MITVHHLNASRSQRILWLLEELELPYEIVRYQRDPKTMLAPPAGTRWNAAARSFHLPGSWVPMGLILAVFLMKYAIGVQLAMQPALAHASGFAFVVTALYGLLSGLFAARTLRVLRSTRGPAAAVTL